MRVLSQTRGDRATLSLAWSTRGQNVATNSTRSDLVHIPTDSDRVLQIVRPWLAFDVRVTYIHGHGCGLQGRSCRRWNVAGLCLRFMFCYLCTSSGLGVGVTFSNVFSDGSRLSTLVCQHLRVNRGFNWRHCSQPSSIYDQ
jgi:hypothetical protein